MASSRNSNDGRSFGASWWAAGVAGEGGVRGGGGEVRGGCERRGGGREERGGCEGVRVSRAKGPVFDRLPLDRLSLHRLSLHRLSLHRLSLHRLSLHRLSLPQAIGKLYGVWYMPLVDCMVWCVVCGVCCVHYSYLSH
jgi:hypothetical protein